MKGGGGAWLAVVAAVLGVLVVVAGAVGLVRANPPDSEPTLERTPSATPTTAPASGVLPDTVRVELPAYYLGATGVGPRLFRELATVSIADPSAENPDPAEGADSGDPRLTAALGLALNNIPEDADYQAAPVQLTLWNARREDDLVVAEVSGVDLPAPRREGPLLVQAVVRTLLETAGTGSAVRFVVDDGAGTRLFGVDVSEPVEPRSAASVLAPVRLTAPEELGVVGQRFTPSGQTTTPGQSLRWRLRSNTGIADSGTTTSEDCCPGASTFDFDVSAPPGYYVLDVSIAGSNAASSDSKRVEVR